MVWLMSDVTKKDTTPATVPNVDKDSRKFLICSNCGFRIPVQLDAYGDFDDEAMDYFDNNVDCCNSPDYNDNN